MALCLHGTQPALLRICSFTLPLSTCHHFLLFSALSSPWGGFVRNVPQQDPLRLQETLELASDFDFLRSFFTFLSVSEVHGLGTKPTGGVIKMPWAGPLLPGCAGLLGHRELMASGQHCRETALPRSSSSAKRSRAEGTACRHRGERSEAEKGLKAVRSGGSAEGSKEEKSWGPLTQ